ncbi:MAG: hypothetical protein H6835_00685 [Planctomycetes bacterium]|nr:hypothetical protein [Planctomycetota bacterium]
MPRIVTLFLLAAAALFLSTAASAQHKVFIPDKFERATKKDENGKLQWDEHKEVQCSSCKGTGKVKCTTCESYPDEATKCPDCGRKEPHEAVCHTCAGLGKFPDPLEQAMCPACLGAGYTVCGFCPGSGILKYPGNPKWANCVSCRGDGFKECAVCKGKRLVDSVKLKPSLAEADGPALKKALTATADLLEKVQAFKTTEKYRDDVKVLEKFFKAGEKLWPCFKQLSSVLDWRMKGVYASSQYQGMGERIGEVLQSTHGNLEYFLKHQKHVLELAVKRVEENEKAAGG